MEYWSNRRFRAVIGNSQKCESAFTASITAVILFTLLAGWLNYHQIAFKINRLFSRAGDALEATVAAGRQPHTAAAEPGSQSCGLTRLIGGSSQTRPLGVWIGPCISS